MLGRPLRPGRSLFSADVAMTPLRLLLLLLLETASFVRQPIVPSLDTKYLVHFPCQIIPTESGQARVGRCGQTQAPQGSHTQELEAAPGVVITDDIIIREWLGASCFLPSAVKGLMMSGSRGQQSTYML